MNVINKTWYFTRGNQGREKKGGEYRSHRQDDMAVGALPRKIHDGQRDLLVLEIDVRDLHVWKKTFVRIQMCVVTRLFVRYGAILRVPWLIRMCATSFRRWNWCVWLACMVNALWESAYVRRDWLTCASWLAHMGECICASWLPHMCVVNSSYVRHD